MEMEDDVVEAVAELLPYTEGGRTPSPSGKPDVLSKIAEAIVAAGATGIKDLGEVMAKYNIDPSARPRVETVLIAREFLLWMEQNQSNDYSVIALPYRPDSAPAASATAGVELELEDILENLRKWWAEKKNDNPSLPVEIKKGCDCTNGKDKPKKLFLSQEKAAKTAAYWSKQNGKKQETYLCPDGKGFHIRTARH